MSETEESLSEIAARLKADQIRLKDIAYACSDIAQANMIYDAAEYLENAASNCRVVRSLMIEARHGIDRDGDASSVDLDDDIPYQDINMSPIPFALLPLIIATGVVLFLGWLALCLAGVS